MQKSGGLIKRLFSPREVGFW